MFMWAAWPPSPVVPDPGKTSGCRRMVSAFRVARQVRSVLSKARSSCLLTRVIVVSCPLGGFPMIEARGLSKRYGRVLAVDALSFEVRPGVVTGFLGPNGSGKSTTMRLMLDLDAPDGGMVRIGGRRHRDLGWPLREGGALLGAKAFHPGRRGRAPPTPLAARSTLSGFPVGEGTRPRGLATPASTRA